MSDFLNEMELHRERHAHAAIQEQRDWQHQMEAEELEWRRQMEATRRTNRFTLIAWAIGGLLIGYCTGEIITAIIRSN